MSEWDRGQDIENENWCLLWPLMFWGIQFGYTDTHNWFDWCNEIEWHWVLVNLDFSLHPQIFNFQLYTYQWQRLQICVFIDKTHFYNVSINTRKYSYRNLWCCQKWNKSSDNGKWYFFETQLKPKLLILLNYEMTSQVGLLSFAGDHINC